MYGIARNVLREHWRHRPAGGDPFGSASEDPWPEVDARLDAAARVLDLRRALARLTPGDRDVLLLVTWEGLTPAQAAIALGIPPGTARSRLHRARALMRQRLEDTSYQEA
ncbi:MAG TPA: sigma-70 family RNA polymerase sigma factor [Streptosporangiaceae bacterium]